MAECGDSTFTVPARLPLGNLSFKNRLCPIATDQESTKYDSPSLEMQPGNSSEPKESSLEAKMACGFTAHRPLVPPRVGFHAAVS